MSHRGPVSHRPWRSRVDPKKRGVKRGERSSGSGAQGPRRSSRHGFMLGRAETRPLRAQRRTTSILIPVTRTKMRLSSAVFGIGNERRARRHLSLARDPMLYRRQVMRHLLRGIEITLWLKLLQGIEFHSGFLPSRLTILHLIRIVQLYLYLS